MVRPVALVRFSPVLLAVLAVLCLPAISQDISSERIRSWSVQLQSPDVRVRRQVATQLKYALKYAGRAAAGALSALNAALADPDMDVRMGASLALAHLGAAAAPAVPALTGLLDDAQPCMRQAALMALASIGPAARQAVPRLQSLRDQDSDGLVRRLADDALQKIGQL